MRPFTPKVGGEELSSNYEPVLMTNRGFAVSPVPPVPGGGASPVLPKRSARMELDAINNKRPFSQKEKLPEVPELEAGITSQDPEVDDDDEEEVFEEIEAPEAD